MDWSRIKHFKREEWEKFPDRIHSEVVYLLDEMRQAAGKPIIIHVAADDSGHVEGSAHYFTSQRTALAVDFHVVGMSLLDQWLLAERFPWVGIGVYPGWEHPGLHCDLAWREHIRLGRRWWRDGGTYRSLDRDLLTRLLG